MNADKMRKMPLVSIIIATYRREIELVRALNSVAGLEYSNFEVVLVDDNDDSIWNEKVEQIVKEFSDINKNIIIKHIINHPNLGSAKTRNVGIDIAEGEYICFLDDDDEYLSKRISNQLIPMIEKDADYSITDLALYNENSKLVEVRKRNYIKEITSEKLFQYHLMYHMTGTDTLMFKKEYLHKIGKFEAIDVGDEFYLMSKAIEAEGKFLYVPICDVKAYVHMGEEGLSSGKKKILGENRIYEFKKQYFKRFDLRTKNYIKMRHYAVLSFSYYKLHKNIDFIVMGIISFLCSPIGCVRLLISMIQGK